MQKLIIIGFLLFSMFLFPSCENVQESMKKADMLKSSGKYSEACEIYLRLAKRENIEAQYETAICYKEGKRGEKDEGLACQWFLKAAMRGKLEAYYATGFCYDKGIGVPKDREKAFEWWLKTAEQGHARAQFLVGISYYLGKGTVKDNDKAKKWLEKAASQGEKEAKKLLTEMKEDFTDMLFDQVKSVLKD